MSKQRMRYQWYQDVPRHVTRHEYQQLQWLNFCRLGLGGLAVAMAIAAIIGLPLQSARQLEKIESLTVEAALAYTGENLEQVKIEGFLVAAEPLTMPDEALQSVIRGQIKITARDDVESSDAEDAPQTAVLYEWAETAEGVSLSDGDRRLPLTFDLSVLPLVDAMDTQSPTVVYTDEPSRISSPVAIQYGDETLPLPLADWGKVDSVFVDFDRQILPEGQSVVVVAGLETTPQGNQIIDPLGDRLQVMLGTEAEIRSAGQQTRLMFAVLCVPFGIGSWLVRRSAQALRREFVQQSNQ